MKKGSVHSSGSISKISEGMRKSWEKRKSKTAVKTNSSQKLKTLSALLNRSQLASRLGKQFGSDRDLYDVLGYTLNLTFNDYFAKYERQDVASRIVDAPPQATWRRHPTVYEDDPKVPSTAFEKEWDALQKRLRIYHYLEKADRLSGIGRYGVLLLGLNDGSRLSTPINSRKLKGPDNLIYLSIYTEGSAEIAEFETNPSNSRFGKPKFYDVNLAGDLDTTKEEAERIHYSRIIHIAENTLEDEVYGRPRLRPVYNLLDDLEKVVGGSAEMFWQGAYRGLHINIDPEYQTGDLDDAELDDLTDEIDEYIHGIRRFIRTQGVDVNALDVELADPSGVFSVIMDLISGTSKIPKRILFGSERGELASEQDEVNWNARITERQEQFGEPQILRPFVDLLLEYEVLTAPSGEYQIQWPSLFEMNELKEAQAAWTWGRAAEKLQVGVDGGLIWAEQDRFFPRQRGVGLMTRNLLLFLKQNLSL
jgi:phage-related protein (TIGR01555 family)